MSDAKDELEDKLEHYEAIMESVDKAIRLLSDARNYVSRPDVALRKIEEVLNVLRRDRDEPW